MKKQELEKIVYSQYYTLKNMDPEDQLWVYESMHRFLNRLGFEVIWSSNDESNYTSFAPTLIFKKGKTKVILSYSNVEVL